MTWLPAYLQIVLVGVLLQGYVQDPDLASPEASLRTFWGGAERRDSVAVARSYALELTGQRFHFSDVPIESYRIVKKTVVDSAAAKAWNDRGTIPAALPGDVELQADLVIAGKPFRASYHLRSFGGRWRIYAHHIWGSP